jgi:hypothetical protein
LNQKLWSDLRRRRASGFNLGERTELERADAKPNPRANKFSPPRMLFVGPNSAPNSGRISAHRSPGGTGGSNPPRSANESARTDAQQRHISDDSSRLVTAPDGGYCATQRTARPRTASAQSRDRRDGAAQRRRRGRRGRGARGGGVRLFGRPGRAGARNHRAGKPDRARRSRTTSDFQPASRDRHSPDAPTPGPRSSARRC